MTEYDKRCCCLREIQQTEEKYTDTLGSIQQVQCSHPASARRMRRVGRRHLCQAGLGLLPIPAALCFFVSLRLWFSPSLSVSLSLCLPLLLLVIFLSLGVSLSLFFIFSCILISVRLSLSVSDFPVPLFFCFGHLSFKRFYCDFINIPYT